MKNFNYTSEAAKSTIRSTVARALAEALIVGINHAEAEGHKLTEVQAVNIATMHIMAYDNALEACEGVDLETELLKKTR